MRLDDGYFWTCDPGGKNPRRMPIEQFSEDAESRRVARDTVGDVVISTVFLSFDHSFGEGQPVLWETMIFGGEHDGYLERYTSYEDAVDGHAKAVALAKTGEGTR